MTITIQQLEKYSEQNPQEVLLVKAQEGETAFTAGASTTIEIMIFKGFSSNLTGATAFDPDLPILSAQGKITSIDRLKSPYNPAEPQYIQQNISVTEFAQLL